MKHSYETVTEENKQVKDENQKQKGIIELFYKLSENIGLFFDKNSTLEHITKTVMDFGSRLFGAFINDNKKDKDFVWNSIFEGQEFKLQQIEKKQKQEQQAKIEKQVDQVLGFGNSKPQVHDRGGRCM